MSFKSHLVKEEIEWVADSEDKEVFMHNGVNIRDLNGLEAMTSQLPLIGFTVLWRLEGMRVSHSDLKQALQTETLLCLNAGTALTANPHTPSAQSMSSGGLARNQRWKWSHSG